MLEELDSELEELDSELEEFDSEFSELEELDSELEELDLESLELEEIFLLTDEELEDLIVLELQDLSSLGSELDELWISLDESSVESESSVPEMVIVPPRSLLSRHAHNRSDVSQRMPIFFIIKNPVLNKVI